MTTEGLALDSLLHRQRELEDHMLAEGARRFRERVMKARDKGRSTEAGASQKLLVTAIEPFEQTIKDFITHSKSAGRGRKHFAYHWLMRFVDDQSSVEEMCGVVAFIATKIILNVSANMGRGSLKVVALSIAERLTDELKYRRYQHEAPGLYKYQQDHFTTTSYSHMSRVLDAGMKFAEIDVSDLDMEPRIALIVGCKLVDLFMQATTDSTGVALVEIQQGFAEKTLGRRRSALRRETNIRLTDEAAAWIDARNDALELHWPVMLPMVVPPLAWSNETRGGYRYALRGKYRLVKGITDAREREVIGSVQPVVYDAVNRIQATAWRINAACMALVEEITNRQSDPATVERDDKGLPTSLCGIPSLTVMEEPRRPPEIEEFNAILKTHKNRPDTDLAELAGSRLDEVLAYADEWKVWRKRTGVIKNAEHRRTMLARSFIKVYATARGVKDEEALWFPCNIDFRGRVYPLVNYLTPHGDDLSRGLLTFADSKPLGDSGASWLALHGANVADEIEGVKLSKLTLQQRVDWIIANTVRIESAVSDPFGDTWWMEAENPIQFFAFMVEWAGYVKLAREGRGAEYQCSLPCSMDGTCNGLQHYSALLLDESSGRAVNVVPSDRPQDIYQSIADKVMARLETDAATEPMARLWLSSGVVGRKLAKRPTMTFPYGSRKFGFKDQIVEFLKTHEEWPRLQTHFGTERNSVANAALYMASVVWSAINESLDGAVRGMDWLQGVARTVCQKGKRVEWIVPGTGLRVRQEYMHWLKRCVNTCLNGKLVYPTVHTQTTKPDARKQANAVAPNFIHSLDASCLMLTVGSAAAEGVDSFMMVHDSYGTHASDCDVLAMVTREVFFRLYSRQDILADFAAQMKRAYDIEVPTPPTKGTLDLSQVIVSDYFFC